jgi:hypothetical protein
MKTRFLLLTLLFPFTAVLAVDPPKLVPRPIPGMSAPTPVRATVAPAPLASTQQPASTVITNPDRARILYIHRRATLPEELTKNLPVSQAAPTVAATMLNVRQGTVKIIPKSQVAQIITPKP